MKGTEVRNHFAKNDPVLYAYMETITFDDWLAEHPMKRKGFYFEALCRAIVGQQLSGKAADSIYKRFKALFKGKVTPANILKTPEQDLRDVGMSWAKVRSVKSLAELVTRKELILDELDALEDSGVIDRLIKVKGIGEWTAEMFLMFTLGREDVFSFKDLGLKKGIEKVYKLKNPTESKIKKIIAKWGPYKTYGSITLWHSLEIS